MSAYIFGSYCNWIGYELKQRQSCLNLRSSLLGDDRGLFLQRGMVLIYCSVYCTHPANDALVLVRQMPHPHFHNVSLWAHFFKFAGLFGSILPSLFYFWSWQRRLYYPPFQRLYCDIMQLVVRYGEIEHCHKLCLWGFKDFCSRRSQNDASSKLFCFTSDLFVEMC